MSNEIMDRDVSGMSNAQIDAYVRRPLTNAAIFDPSVRSALARCLWEGRRIHAKVYAGDGFKKSKWLATRNGMWAMALTMDVDLTLKNLSIEKAAD